MYKGLTPNLVSDKSLSAKPRAWQSDIYQDTHYEQSPYTPPVQINKGTMSVTAGGIVDFQDVNGSSIFNYNATTGAIAINSNVILTGNFTVNGTSSLGTISTINVPVGTISTLTVGTIPSMTNGTTTFLTVSGTATIGEMQMVSNTGNKVREYFGLGFALADKTGSNAVRIQNSDLTDLIQMNSKGGITFIPQSSISSPDEGQMYYDSDDNKLKFWNGSAWETITSST